MITPTVRSLLMSKPCVCQPAVEAAARGNGKCTAARERDRRSNATRGDDVTSEKGRPEDRKNRVYQ